MKCLLFGTDKNICLSISRFNILKFNFGTQSNFGLGNFTHFNNSNFFQDVLDLGYSASFRAPVSHRHILSFQISRQRGAIRCAQQSPTAVLRSSNSSEGRQCPPVISRPYFCHIFLHSVIYNSIH